MNTPSAEPAGEGYPAPFFREMAERFLSRRSNVFLLTGNVNDQVDGLAVTCPAEEPDHADRFCYADDYLTARLESRGRLVVTYNIARGMEFTSPARRARFRALWTQFSPEGPVSDPAVQQRRAQEFDRIIFESQVLAFATLREVYRG